MAEILTTSQLNKIGERLRKGVGTEEDLRVLDDFRVSFEPAYQKVFAELVAMGHNPGGRPQKTTQSIVAKLERERSRLSKMQDIAGCRIEVEDLVEQDRVVEEIRSKFPRAIVHDRRAKPSYGYRAVHLVVDIDGRLVEIQVRTVLQHTWASATEKFADTDPEIKYGGGPEELKALLERLSKVIATMELMEKESVERRSRGEILTNTDEARQTMAHIKAELISISEGLIMRYGNEWWNR